MDRENWELFKESIMDTVHVVYENSQEPNGAFKRTDLALEAGINLDDPEEKGRFDLALYELDEDDKRLIPANKNKTHFTL